MSELFSSFSTLQCAFKFTICINENNEVCSFGENVKGKCGHDIKNRIVLPPKQINNLNNIQFISCGADHTICCDYDGKIFSFGENSNGQLGINKTKQELFYSSIPQQINLPQIHQISCGLYFSVCLSVDGDLWSFGDNSYGQLGIGNTINSPKPLKINNLSDIDYIICGGFFSFCKTITNDYYSWGQNNYGQLVQSKCQYLLQPLKCNNIPDDIISIRSGVYHILFLTSNGVVYSSGYNAYGQLGHGNNRNLSIPKEISSLPHIIKISCGYYHSFCIDIDNNLWVFGYNNYGQLGLGHINSINNPTKHVIVNNIMDISALGYHTFIKTVDNIIYSFGHNNSSQIGIKTKDIAIKEPIQVFKNNEDIWKTNIHKSRAKSARK